jgi:DNA-binding MarR family transcriptional regulator
MAQPEPDRRLIGELLRNPNAARVRHVERGFAEAGHAAIRPPHLPVFEYLDHGRGSRITDLAGHANVTPQAMSEVVGHLERHGYVERVADPGDGRAKLVRLTDRGWDAYGVARRLVTELEAKWAARVGEEKLRQLKGLLGELCDAIASEEAAASNNGARDAGRHGP